MAVELGYAAEQTIQPGAGAILENKCLTMALEKQMRIEQIENEMGYSEGYGDDMSGRRGQYMNQQSGHYPPPWYPERGRW